MATKESLWKASGYQCKHLAGHKHLQEDKGREMPVLYCLVKKERRQTGSDHKTNTREIFETETLCHSSVKWEEGRPHPCKCPPASECMGIITLKSILASKEKHADGESNGSLEGGISCEVMIRNDSVGAGKWLSC